MEFVMPIATSRLNFRVSSATQQLLVQAAEAQGTDLTSFVVSAASDQARRVLLEERALRVSSAEAMQIQTLLTTDVEPTALLRDAAARLQESGN
jgi:uncharacterized protein (DUF1778 family)